MIEVAVYKARRDAQGAIVVDPRIVTSLEELSAAYHAEGWSNTEDAARASLMAVEGSRAIETMAEEQAPAIGAGAGDPKRASSRKKK